MPICTPANLGRTLLIKNGNARYELSRLDEDGRFAELYEVDRDRFGAWEYEVVERLFVLREEAPRPICIPENVGKTLVAASGRRYTMASFDGVFVRLVPLFSGGFAWEEHRDIVERDFRLADEPAPCGCNPLDYADRCPHAPPDPVTAAYAALPPFEPCRRIGGFDCGLPAGHGEEGERLACVSRSLTAAEECARILADRAKSSLPPAARFLVGVAENVRKELFEPTPPPKPHRFDDPYCAERGTRLCVDCGDPQAIPFAAAECSPSADWRVRYEQFIAATQANDDAAPKVPPPRPSPHAPSISGLGAIACRLSSRRK